MAIEYEIKSYQRFTSDGRFGVWLFICSPIVSGLTWWWLEHVLSIQGRYDAPSPLLPAAILAASGVAFLAGIVLMLIGREQSYSVRPL